MKMKRFFAVLLVLAMALCALPAGAEEESWICPGCGAENTSNFCTQCGTAKPEDAVCPECGSVYPAAANVLFCGNCGTKLTGGEESVQTGMQIHYEGPGFDTPEEALTCYMEGLKNLDFEQMLSAFAWETQVEHISPEAYIGRLKAYSPVTIPRMPVNNDFMSGLTLNALRGQQVTSIYRAVEYYILTSDAPMGMTIPFADEEAVDAFMAKFSNGRLELFSQMSDLQFLDPDVVTGGKYSLEVNQENRAKQYAYLNADEVVNIVCVAEIGEETVGCCPTIARYGDRWYLVSTSSYTLMILGVSVDCQAFFSAPGTVEDLLELFQ